MKASEFIANALFEIGVVGAGQTPAPEIQAAGLTVLQRLVDAKGAERLTIFEVLRTVRALSSGTRDYTIGTGGSINIVRPTWIDHAAVILDSTLTDPQERPIAVFTDQQWQHIALKTLDAATIDGIFYDHGLTSYLSQVGTISTYPTINVANVQLVLYTPKAVAAFVDLDTQYAVPPGYQDAYHYELSYRLQRPLGRPLDADLKAERDVAWGRVKRANIQIPEMTHDAAVLFGAQRVSNIYTGE